MTEQSSTKNMLQIFAVNCFAIIETEKINTGYLKTNFIIFSFSNICVYFHIIMCQITKNQNDSLKS